MLKLLFLANFEPKTVVRGKFRLYALKIVATHSSADLSLADEPVHVQRKGGLDGQRTRLLLQKLVSLTPLRLSRCITCPKLGRGRSTERCEPGVRGTKLEFKGEAISFLL